MRRAVKIEALRRVATLLLLTLAGIFGLRYGPAIALVVFSIAVIVYLLIPREGPPEGALLPEPVPAVLGPDMLGLLVGSVFLGLPFAAAVFEGEPLGTIHLSAFLAWPMAIFAFFILAVATKYAVYWVVIESDGLHIADVWGIHKLRFASIIRVEPYRQSLPRVFRWLAPLLIAFGQYTQAGAILLTRDTTGIRLVPSERECSVVITEEGFEQPFKRIVRTLRRSGVKFVDG